MATFRTAIMKPKKTQMLRVRCEESWKYELEVFARYKKLDVSDIVRIAIDELRAKHQGSNVQSHAA